MTRPCSTIAPVAASSVAADVVPQKGQTRACLPGCQIASAPHAGQANFSWASSSAMGADDSVIRSRAGDAHRRRATAFASTLLDEIADDPPDAVSLALQRYGLVTVDLVGETGAKHE